MPQPYAAAERIFDSLCDSSATSAARELRARGIRAGFSLNTAPDAIAGLGPFRLQAISCPGERIVLERNPYYWKADRNKQRLPYLDEVAFLFVGNEDAQILRFESRETNIISRFSPDNYACSWRASSRPAGTNLSILAPASNTTSCFSI